MTLRRAIKANNYDSVLDLAQPRRPAKLTIRLKVALLPRDPSGPPGSTHLAANMAAVHRGRVKDADNHPFRCRSWMTAEWNVFKIRLKRMVELVWNNQAVLLAPDDPNDRDALSDEEYLQFVSDPQVPAHVECAFDVELSPVVAGAHARVEVVHLEKTEHHNFRSHSRLMSNDDVDFDNYREKGVFYAYLTAAHELGHWLGAVRGAVFQHVEFSECSTLPGHRPNDDCEYGRTVSKKRSIMGGGNILTDYDALPWIRRMRQHAHMAFPWLPIPRPRLMSLTNGPGISERQRRLTAKGKP